ncbi:NADPH--cytochrome P450 reductase [Hetaerina americana]|uniref:NADPH--cytochrome P450 reductase n=1 Tax=Hetaerina americana TaxID=62018 RepID=UPI003A7F4C1D
MADSMASNVPVSSGMEGGGSVEGPTPMFGYVDMVLLATFAGVIFYWFIHPRLQSRKDEATAAAAAAAASRSYTMQPSSMVGASSTSFVKKLQNSGRSLVVFYGSQTGTAEEFAGRLAKEGTRYRLKGMVADPEECDMEELTSLKEIENSMAIFCLATYGEGDPTDNAQEFFEWLQNGDCDLSGLNYAVFGLGNKTYEHYNEMAKYVDRRLEELGGTRVFELGLGDDDANIEDDFITWKDRLWPTVCEFFGLDSSGAGVDGEATLRQYKLTVRPDVPLDRIYTGEVARLHSLTNQRPPYDAKNPYVSKVIAHRELHKGGDRSCMHIEFDIEGSKMRYDAGDHVAVYPTNDETLVEAIGGMLLSDKDGGLDIVFTLTNVDEESSKRHPFPCPCSYRTALMHYIDITSNPRTHIIKELVEYTKDPEEREKLQLMSSTSPEGKQLYNEWVIQDNRNIVHILQDLPSCRPPIDHLCELLPRMQARYYSISSSPKVHPNAIHVTAVLVQYETPTGRINKGVATSWLSKKMPTVEANGTPVIPTPNMEVVEPTGSKVEEAIVKAIANPNSTVPIYVRKSQFRLPSRSTTPVIMIGPGTGLAPFRGFIQERNFAKEEGKPVGETVLYFGCRKKDEDFIYEDELSKYVKNGVLKMHVAFSRDGPEKVYVTHLLQQNADEVWRIVGEGNGHLYVCGDARNMARDVHDIVLKIVESKGNLTAEQALAYVKRMEAQKRYSADVWS